MHSSRFAVASILAISLVACADATGPRPLTDMNMQNGMSTMSIPFYHVAVNSCNGEWVELDGRLHMSWRVGEDGFSSQTNYQGVSGRGLASGTQYRSTAMDQFRLGGPLPEQIFWKGHFMLVSQGVRNNLHVTVMFKFSVTPDGEVKPGGQDILSVRCVW